MPSTDRTPAGLSREAYDLLRTETLDRTVPGLGATTFAQVASWAVWAEPTADGMAWSRDLSVLSYDALAPVAHTRAVFVAPNHGVGPGSHDEADWSSFHSGRSDYRLARALATPGAREVLQGAYVTDFFKGLPTPTAADLARHLGRLDAAGRERTVADMARLLRRELEILGADSPLLVGVGRAASEWLRRALPEHRVTRITHYAAAVPSRTYAGELLSVARQVRAA